jgi:hypothetical protein
MVSVSGITLDDFGGAPAGGAVAFSLLASPRRSQLRSFPAEQWEVELRDGLEWAVARTGKTLSHDALIDEGIEMVHRTLDLTSIQDHDHLVTQSPADEFISFHRQDERSTVRYCATIDFPVQLDVSIRIQVGDGTFETASGSHSLEWSPAFRFYRLSQSNRDLFDAFRNLYLSLEALLEQLWPQKAGERERPWLDRALFAASAKVNFAAIATPGSASPIEEVAGRIYDVRIHLFHAKSGRTFIPDEAVGYLKVARVYRILFSLWTEIVREWITTNRKGGTLTNVGFKMMVERMLASAQIAVTADDTVAGTNDPISPKGMPVTRLPDPIRVFEIKPGQMAWAGEIDSPFSDLTIGRIAIVDERDVPLIVNSIKGGLSLRGADRFEMMNVNRLLNRGRPRLGVT